MNDDTIEYTYNDWEIVFNKSHIMKSICPNGSTCSLERPDQCCELCFYDQKLQLPHLPDMVFPRNVLALTHRNGGRLEFNVFDALSRIRKGQSYLEIACAEEWRETRPHQYTSNKLKPFDWTFSTDYQGTVNDKITLERTELQLDLQKLMQKEEILFYRELILYEDELHDNGVAICSVKIRIMPSGFFILLRYFLRVDNVMIRMNDSRFHYENGNEYILKEYISRESKISDLQKHVPAAQFVNPHEIEKYLTVSSKLAEKLIINQ